MSRKHFTPLARPQAFFTTDESAQYFECGYSCDHAILLVLDARKIFSQTLATPLKLEKI